jgi:hypothetical protein
MKTHQFNPGRWLIFLSLAALLTLTGCALDGGAYVRRDIYETNGTHTVEKGRLHPALAFGDARNSIGQRKISNTKTGNSIGTREVSQETSATNVAPIMHEGGALIGEAARTFMGLPPTTVSGKVCEKDDVDGVDAAKELLQVPPLIYFHIAHGKTFRGLNRRFTQERLVPSDAPFVWTLNQANLIRPDLRGTDRESTWLTLRRLGTATNNTNPDFPEWAVRNRAGYPVKLEARILRGEVNLLSAATPPQYTVSFQHYDTFDRVSIIVQDGHWLLQTRAKDQGFDWQPLRFMVPGQTYVQIYEADFLPQEYRVIRAIE